MITYLKLGGSLITDKNKPHTIRQAVLQRLAGEIRAALDADPELQLIIGHGSGSFGHVPASQYGTRDGVATAEQWRGFAQVHAEAAELNRTVTAELRKASVDCLTFDPLSLFASGSDNYQRASQSVFTVLEKGLVPLVYGDTVLNPERGGTILSTEEVFIQLASAQNQPARFLLAGDEPGIWRDFPEKTELIPSVDISLFHQMNVKFICGAATTDVTGGMRAKVNLAVSLLKKGLGKEVLIFSGLEPQNVFKALLGENPGTLIA
jgi:isopentenyl phosphate kinase